MLSKCETKRVGEAHACNVHTQELEDRGKFKVPGLSRETLPQNKKRKKEKKRESARQTKI